MRFDPMGLPTKSMRLALIVIAAAVSVSLLVALFLRNPAASRFFLPCPVHYVTGLHCPGCGSLRASHNLLHGRLAAALSLNPLMVIAIPVVAVMLLRPAWVYRRRTPWAALSVLVAYGILRNLPWWPFTLLAPT